LAAINIGFVDFPKTRLYVMEIGLAACGGGLSPFFIEQDWLPYQYDFKTRLSVGSCRNEFRNTIDGRIRIIEFDVSTRL
jgi:hypothetical protein